VIDQYDCRWRLDQHLRFIPPLAPITARKQSCPVASMPVWIELFLSKAGTPFQPEDAGETIMYRSARNGLGMLFVALAMALLSMFFSPTSVFGQDASSERLRALLKDVPQLPVEQIELKVNPPMRLEGISAVTADRRGNIYLIHRPENGDPIVVLDANGNFLRSWGKGMFTIPHGIRIDPDGNVWTLDAHTTMVFKFTPEGKKLLEFAVGDIPERTPAWCSERDIQRDCSVQRDERRDFCGPTDIAFAGNGHFFISDGYCNARVIEYDAMGKKLREWGSFGTGPGQFKLVHSIAIGPQGNVYVADRENGRLQWFDQSGKYLGEWDYGGRFYAVAFGPSGEFYAAIIQRDVSLDAGSNVIRIDLASGKILGKFGVRAHELGMTPDGTLLPATINGQLLLLKPRP
jgi:hypothetical protein